MGLVICDNGEKIALGNAVNKTAPENLVLRLFTNDKTPAHGDGVGDYTESTGAGYSAITLTGGSWNAAIGSKVGTCDTSGTAVTHVSGDQFTGLVPGATITINGVAYTIASVTDATHLILAASAGAQSGVAFASWSFITYGQQTFTFTAAASGIYGYYLTRASTGDLFGAERFGGTVPYPIENNGDQVKVTPLISAESLY